MSAPLAHSGGHLLEDHLLAVAGLAAGFSEGFEPALASQRWANGEALWHDLGKYSPGFQNADGVHRSWRDLQFASSVFPLGATDRQFAVDTHPCKN